MTRSAEGQGPAFGDAENFGQNFCHPLERIALNALRGADVKSSVARDILRYPSCDVAKDMRRDGKDVEVMSLKIFIVATNLDRCGNRNTREVDRIFATACEFCSTFRSTRPERYIVAAFG